MLVQTEETTLLLRVHSLVVCNVMQRNATAKRKQKYPQYSANSEYEHAVPETIKILIKIY